MKILIAIVIGASLGALLRYGLSLRLNPLFPSLPLGTLTVNWLGAFLMGIMVTITLHTTKVPREVLTGVSSGFLGSLTTMSTFSAETYALIANREYFYTCLHLFLQVGGSIILVFLGVFLSKLCILGGK